MILLTRNGAHLFKHPLSTALALNSPDNGLTAPFYLRDGVPTTPTSPELNDSFGAVAPGKNPNTSVAYYEPSRPTGYSHQFNFGIQHELPGSAVMEVSVLGNLGRKLPNGNLSLNQISPEILRLGYSSQKDRPFPQFSEVQIIAPTMGTSNYYAGLVRFQKRYSRGLNLGGNYTYAKFLGNISDSGLGNNGGPYSNYYNRSADYGPAVNDIRHRFTFNAVYELPFGPGRQWLSTGLLGKVVGGWSIANVTTLQSGAPFTVTTQTNTTNSFSAGEQRADVFRNPNLPSDERSVSRWFDTVAFAQPGIFLFGNQGVGVLRGPGLINLDFSVLRDFQITENARFQFRGEFFNALNHTNLGLPGRTFGAAGFGVINSAGPARQIQLGARLAF